MNEENYDIEFNKKIKELNRLYKENPSETLEMLDEIITYSYSDEENENVLSSEGQGVIKEIGKDKLSYIVIITILVFSGLLNLGENTMMHFFGLIFFLAGFFCGKCIPGFGLIFLFSHGCTGLGVMIGGLFSTDFYQGLVTDLSQGIKTYFAIGIASIVIAIFIMIFYNLSPTLRKNKKLPIISISLFTFSVVMANLLPYIYTDVIRILG